jgi:hypothetical protein
MGDLLRGPAHRVLAARSRIHGGKMKLLYLYFLIVGSAVVGAVVLFTAAATFYTGKYHLTFINIVLFVWVLFCISWARSLIKEVRDERKNT